MSQKHLCLIFSLLTLLPGAKAFAEVLHWPEVCSGGELMVKNKTSSDLSIWLQKFDTQLTEEEEYPLPAAGLTEIPISSPSGESHSLLNFNPAAALEFSYRCGGRDYPVNSFEGGTLTFRRSDLPENKIWLQNLYTDTNGVEIEFLDFSFQKISSESLNLQAREGLTFVTGYGQKDWAYFRITASGRYSVFNLSSNGAEGPVLVSPQKTRAENDGAYFLVGPRSGTGDTFVVKISDPRVVAQARDLAAVPREKMLFARIEKGHQGFNRNFSRPEKALWSWSASEVTGFGDLGSTACNGAPQLVEDRIDNWLLDPGQICFWNYRIKRELTPSEVSTGNLK